MALDETEAKAESLAEAVVLANDNDDAIAQDVTMAEALAATIAVALTEAFDMADMFCQSQRQV